MFKFNSLALALVTAALGALLSGASVSQAVAGAKARQLKAPKTAAPSATKQVGSAGGYCTARITPAADRRRAAKRRNVLKNRRAQRRAKH